MSEKTNKIFKPLVSIIIPSYNGADYLREAIDSALAQNYKNIEIIVVNDGSTDDTEKIAKSYGEKIRYFSKENGGAATALNLAIKNMKGDYFSWLSDDDLYYPNKISRQVEELSKLKNKNTIMMSDLDGINAEYEKIYQTDYMQHIKNYEPRLKSNIHPVIFNQTHGCTLLIPKIVFDKVGLFDKKQLVAQDFEFFYRAFSRFPHKLIPEALVTARDTNNRVGVKKKDLANKEYSALYISIINALTDDDVKLLAKSRIDFYHEMEHFFKCAEYSIALDYIQKKLIKNLQITSHDLIGNKFNGYDLHLQLRERGIDSKLLVQSKHSADNTTFVYDFSSENAAKKLVQQNIFLESDIIHLHLIHNIIDLNYLPLMTRLKPTIITLHDPFFLGGHCVHHFDCKKWQKCCYDCKYLNEVFALDGDISALNFTLKKDAIQNSEISAIVASKWMKDKVEKSPIWRGKKIFLLPLAVNQGLFKPNDSELARKELGITPESTVIMFRAEEDSFKGLDIIRQALLSIRNAKNITLVTVGRKGLMNEFRGKFKILEYDWIKDDEMLSRLYQACDLFLMPSRQETFGMMAIEAMSCGKMVLALKNEGSALTEVINSPDCGLSVDEGDFNQELLRLLQVPNEVIERGQKSLKFAQKEYSEGKYIRNIIKIYKEVMTGHKPTKSSELLLSQLKKYGTDNLSLAKNITEDLKRKKTLLPRVRIVFEKNQDSATNNINKFNFRLIKRIVWRVLRYISPTFRLLEGNRNKLDEILNDLDSLKSSKE